MFHSTLCTAYLFLWLRLLRIPILQANGTTTFDKWPKIVRSAFYCSEKIGNSCLSRLMSNENAVATQHNSNSFPNCASTYSNWHVDSLLMSQDNSQDNGQVNGQGKNQDSAKGMGLKNESCIENATALCSPESEYSADFIPERKKPYCEYPIERLYFKTIDSTQKWALRNFALLQQSYGLNIEKWIEIAANEQQQGVGSKKFENRQENSWFSPPSNVYVTYVIPWPVSKRPLFFCVAQTATLAVLKTLQHFGLDARLKWVNDVYVDGKKVSGVLSQSSGLTMIDPLTLEEYTDMLIGIGINLNQPPEALSVVSQPATSISTEIEKLRQKRLFDASSFSPRGIFSAQATPMFLYSWKTPYSIVEKVPTADQVLQVLSSNLYTCINTLLSKGFSHLWSFVDSKLIWKNENVILDDENAEYRGVLIGIDSDGSLLLRVQGMQKKFFTGKLYKEKIE